MTVELGTLDEERLARAGEESEYSREAGWTGLVVEELTPEKARELGYEGAEGVLVVQVVENSPADREGMVPGMLILEVEGHPVRTPEEFQRAVEEAGDSVLIKWRLRDRTLDRYGITVLNKRG
ncbi:MAG: hypothetical protein KatS3mg115_2318 [Candidatus Poribacteria bacterium]|nr:MAG: hypothetical protein KatS3mg115_2318 [Candidatus Poribacteria bacterium]